MKKFESAVVFTSFIDKDLSKTIKSIAKYIKEEDIPTIDTSFAILSEYCDTTDKWYSSIMSHYQNDKKIVKLIKDKP